MIQLANLKDNAADGTCHCITCRTAKPRPRKLPRAPSGRPRAASQHVFRPHAGFEMDALFPARPRNRNADVPLERGGHPSFCKCRPDAGCACDDRGAARTESLRLCRKIADAGDLDIRTYV